MARIAPLSIESASPEAQAVLKEIESAFGMVPNVFKTMAHYPPLLALNWSRVKALMMSGSLSKNRRGFPDAFQHDMVLGPNEIGGPVVALDGHVVGMNIARSGRIECFAIPAKTIKTLLSSVAEGKFFHPELDALRDERKNAEASLERLKKELEQLSQRIKDAEAPPAK